MKTQKIYPDIADAEMILDNEEFAKEAAERANVPLEEIRKYAEMVLKGKMK